MYIQYVTRVIHGYGISSLGKLLRRHSLGRAEIATMDDEKCALALCILLLLLDVKYK